MKDQPPGMKGLPLHSRCCKSCGRSSAGPEESGETFASRLFWSLDLFGTTRICRHVWKSAADGGSALDTPQEISWRTDVLQWMSMLREKKAAGTVQYGLSVRVTRGIPVTRLPGATIKGSPSSRNSAHSVPTPDYYRHARSPSSYLSGCISKPGLHQTHSRDEHTSHMLPLEASSSAPMHHTSIIPHY